MLGPIGDPVFVLIFFALAIWLFTNVRGERGERFGLILGGLFASLGVAGAIALPIALLTGTLPEGASSSDVYDEQYEADKTVGGM